MKLTNEEIFNAVHRKVGERKYFDFGPVEGFISYFNSDTFYVWFPGTADIVDAMFDAKFWKKVVPYYGTNPKIKVHTGFIQQYKLVRDHIQSRFLSSGLSKVVVVGHSLGGALATLCGLDLQYNFHADVAVIPTGSPRVGNREFVRSFNGRVKDVYRYIYRTDLVTRIPPAIFGYRHVSKKIQLGKGRFPIPVYKFIASMMDHLWGNYKREIDSLCVTSGYQEVGL